MKNKHRGVLLITTLGIMTVLGILLLATVQSLSNSVFFARKVSMGVKAYWAAWAGLEYGYSCLSVNSNWAGNSSPISLGCGYSVENTNGIVTGTDQDTETEFYFNFTQSSNNEKNLNYYSINHSEISDSNSIPINANGRSLIIPEYTVYLSSEGRVRNTFRSNLEEMITVVPRTLSSSAGAIYAGGINISGLSDSLYIRMKEGDTNSSQAGASIVSTSDIYIQSSAASPINCGGGNLFVGGTATLKGGAGTFSAAAQSASSQYDVKVLNANSVSLDEVPEPTKEGTEIPSGMFVFIQMPETETVSATVTEESEGKSYKDFYELYKGISENVTPFFYKICRFDTSQYSEADVESPMAAYQYGPYGGDIINKSGNTITQSEYESADGKYNKYLTFLKTMIENDLLTGVDTEMQNNLTETLAGITVPAEITTELSALTDEAAKKDKINELLKNGTLWCPAYKDNTLTSGDNLDAQEKKYSVIRANKAVERNNKSIEEVSSTYSFEPIFIPKETLNAGAKGENLYLENSTYHYAQQLCDLNLYLDELKGRSKKISKLLSTSEIKFTNPFLNSYIDKEISATEDAIKDILSTGLAEYVLEQQELCNGNEKMVFSVLKKIGDTNTYFSNGELGNVFSFEETLGVLTLKLQDSVWTDGYFGLVAMERTDTKYSISQTKRGILKLGDGDNKQIYAGEYINIKGIIAGQGTLAAVGGDVDIEAGAKINAGIENYLAVYSTQGNININEVSALSVISSAGGSSTSPYQYGLNYQDVLVSYLEEALKEIGSDISLYNGSEINQAAVDAIVNNGITVDNTSLSNTYEYTDESGNVKEITYAEAFNEVDPSELYDTSKPESGETPEVQIPDGLVKEIQTEVVNYTDTLQAGETAPIATTITSNFKGILYTNNNINITGTSQDIAFALEGVIICKGSLNISGMGYVQIVYDPTQSAILTSFMDEEANQKPVLNVIGFNRISK